MRRKSGIEGLDALEGQVDLNGQDDLAASAMEQHTALDALPVSHEEILQSATLPPVQVHQVPYPTLPTLHPQRLSL